MKQNTFFMKKAITFAQMGLGKTYPNPPVGAVVVKNGKIIGKGYHIAEKKTHAEIKALQDTSDSCQDADLYVTLEPCSTTGKTGPCTSAIIDKGIKNVFVGTKDPSQTNGGRAKSILEKNNIGYEDGICKEECEDLIAPFKTYCHKKRPWITLKSAISLDGRISDDTGKLWLSSQKSIQSVHRLRSQVDAILIGNNTFIKDNPRLTIRRKGFLKKVPLRIVFFSGNTLPHNHNLFRYHPEKTLIVTQKNVLTQALQKLGVMQFCYKSRNNFLPHFIEELYHRNIVHLLLEGGSGIYSSFLKHRLVDEMYLYLCPFLIGSGPSWLPQTQWSTEQNNLFFLKKHSYKTIGPDLLIKGQVQYK